MQLAADKFVQDELVDRLNSINERLNTLRVESEEVSTGEWKVTVMFVQQDSAHFHSLLTLWLADVVLGSRQFDDNHLGNFDFCNVLCKTKSLVSFCR